MKPYDSDRTKKEQVRAMFDGLAPRYDLLNPTLSLSIDRLWRRRAVAEVRRVQPRRILDAATGTGDLALALARSIAGAEVRGIDLSEGMLAEARRKAAARGLADRAAFAWGDAEHLDAADGSFDAATVAFGVRNFDDPDAGLRELARVVRPGGRVVILEFSRPRNRVWRALYESYSFRILPRIGGLVSHDRRAYEYLPASVVEFPAPEEFLRRMERAGLRRCRTRSLSGGIARLYVGVRCIDDE